MDFNAWQSLVIVVDVAVVLLVTLYVKRVGEIVLGNLVYVTRIVYLRIRGNVVDNSYVGLVNVSYGDQMPFKIVIADFIFVDYGR